jgi:PKD repeat protein
VYDAYASNLGSVGENIQFNGSVEPLTGQPPYTYHWDFGDQSSSTELNPTHTYGKTGVYTYTFTVTDNADATASQTGTITISAEGAAKEPLSTQMILFLAILLIVIVIGVIVIVWIIRR